MQPCSKDPLTGFFRDGHCNTCDADRGSHTVCAVRTDAFLSFSKSAGNDLSTPRPEFGFAGLTPGDPYWAWINRETGLMDQWAYFLQGWEDDKTPTRWQWLDWQQYGDIKLSPNRVNPDGDRKAELGNLAVLDHLPDSLFESPEPAEGQ